MSSGIFWLASYPKSGNTWTRAFIANLRREEEDEETDINELRTDAMASARDWIDGVLGFDSGDLGNDEKSPKHEAFFRKGIVGDWQETLSPEQIERIVADHHVVMKRFGYLDASGNPVTSLPQELCAP